MRHFLLTTILLIGSICTYAQVVRYSYKPLAAEGCRMSYSVTKQDTSYYIIATVSSDRMKFLKESTMMIKTFNDEILKLDGTLIDNDTESAGLVSGKIVIPVTEIKSTAQFKITPKQFELLQQGVKKIRLSTIPIKHERTFKKDKIGKKLYIFFIEQQKEEDDF